MGCGGLSSTIEKEEAYFEKIHRKLQEGDINIPKLKESQTSYEKYNWEEMLSKIPTELTEDGKEKRFELWIELNNNKKYNYISYKRLHYNLTTKLDIPNIIRKKNPIKLACEVACDKYHRNAANMINYLIFGWREFRIFLVYLKEYFEYWRHFKYLENNGEHTITLEDFKKALSLMKKFNCDINENKIEKEFNNIDKGKGSISFDEFCKEIIQKSINNDENKKFDESEIKKLKKVV